MIYLKNYSILIAVLLLSACASKGSPASFTFPNIGEVTTKNVGEELLKQGTGRLEPVLIVFNDEIINNLPLLKGVYEYDGENSRRIQFDRDGPNLYFMKESKKICIDGDSENKCASIKFSLEKRISKKSENSFQQTLLYNGKIENRISIGYREFSNSLARPAFSNEVAYDLSASSLIGYKGARIEVINATNTEITYRILSGFN